MTDPQTYSILDELIGQDACFAIYKRPDETTPRFVMQSSGAPCILNDIGALDGQKGFVIAPFHVTAESPIVVIRPDCTSLPGMEFVKRDELTERKEFHEGKKGEYLTENPNQGFLPGEAGRNRFSEETERNGFSEKTDQRFFSEKSEQINPIKDFGQKAFENNGKSGYAHLFERFHQPLAAGEMKKIVLSRSKSVTRSETFSPGRSFFTAAEKYPHSYVYLFHTPQSGTWLGSTPEILLTGKNDEWHTIALAGTRYPNSGIVTWDDKNLREQHLVTSYLLKQLSSFHITPEINGPYTVKAGNLAHLRTDISFHLADASKPGTLLKALHPTPAVLGLPKNDAHQFILGNEAHNRLYYTGFLGMLDTEVETGIYVNLRCMQIGKKSLTLFAGSGLLASSTLDDEWEETEHKLKTMLDILD